MHTNRNRIRNTPIMMPETINPVAATLMSMLKTSALKNTQWLAALRLAAAGVLLLAMVACGGDSEQDKPGTAADQLAPGTTVSLTPAPSKENAGGQSGEASAAASGVQPHAAASPSRGSASAAAGEQVDAGDSATSFPVPPERDFFRLAEQLIPGIGTVERVVRTQSTTLEPGHRITLNLVDLDSRQLYESEFELLHVSPHAYWLFEDAVDAELDDIQRSAKEFEEVIYPAVTGAFGTEWTPGVDGDPHLYVVVAHLRGAGGYFNAADEYPREVRPISNEIEAIYINARYLPVGSEMFSQVLAHELQHAVHWRADLSDETWVNEGLSELAVTIAGYPEFSIFDFRRAGPTSLTQWPANDIGGSENYGAASLFMHYLAEHYVGEGDLRPLLDEPADGIPGIDAYLEASGHGVTFTNVFRDWAVANLLDEEEGLFGYSDLSFRVPVYGNAVVGRELRSTIPQYSNEYVRLGRADDTIKFTFEGDRTVPLLPVEVGDGCWWSNKGDVIDSTLTARVDLRNVEQALLEYDLWFSIEEDWDFAYVEVSEDSGRTWAILETPLSSTDDPLQVSFGPGYTGATEGWQRESVSLDRWAGQEVLLRFQYITDAAIHDHGLCVRGLGVTAGNGPTELEVDWVPNGFVQTNNLVLQDFMVQVVFEGEDGTPNRVVQVDLDENNRAETTLELTENLKRIVAIIQPTAPSTRMLASYTIKLDTAE